MDVVRDISEPLQPTARGAGDGVKPPKELRPKSNHFNNGPKFFKLITRPQSPRTLLGWSAAKPQDHHAKTISKPAERATDDTSNVSFVVFNSIGLQELNEFVSKRDLLVMLFLSPNILAHLLHV